MFKQNSSCKPVYSIVFWSFLVLLNYHLPARAERCGPAGEIYGENDIIDQLLSCARGGLLDLDLTPQGEYQKGTPRVLVQQGFSNKTTIVYAKLGGMWSARRPRFVESGWRCEANRTTVTALVEFSGISLEVVERVEIPFHRSQHRLALHKPCKTFDLPLWMCRQSKPVYRTTKTWVNRAFFNLTLTQVEPNKRPEISGLSLMFTCPETLRQKVTHSPSATYILSKFLHQSDAPEGSPEGLEKFLVQPKKRSLEDDSNIVAGNSIAHPVMFATTQDGKSLATPPYHNSVNLILNQVTDRLRSSVAECMREIDVDLSLMADHNSFSQYKFTHAQSAASGDRELLGEAGVLVPSCSNKNWLEQRIELANLASAIDSQGDAYSVDPKGPAKRNSYMINYPVDPNDLLNPYGYYHDNANQMVEDN